MQKPISQRLLIWGTMRARDLRYKERAKAVRDTMMTAMLASGSCQNINQVMSMVNGEA